MDRVQTSRFGSAPMDGTSGPGPGIWTKLGPDLTELLTGLGLTFDLTVFSGFFK